MLNKKYFISDSPSMYGRVKNTTLNGLQKSNNDCKGPGNTMVFSAGRKGFYFLIGKEYLQNSTSNQSNSIWLYRGKLMTFVVVKSQVKCLFKK